MANRVNKLYRKIDSSDVQGEGSWVLLKSPTIEDIRGGLTSGDQTSTEQIEYSFSIIGKLIIDWNWVDDEGNPLPKPDYEIVKLLPIQEINFLVQALDLGNLVDRKN